MQKKDEREALRGKFDEWLKCFLPKLERESTRTAKCRLLASFESYEFGEEDYAGIWRFCKFEGNKGILFDECKNKLKEFEATSFQKRILRENQDFLNVLFGRSEITEENGKWIIPKELKKNTMSESGSVRIRETPRNSSEKVEAKKRGVVNSN